VCIDVAEDGTLLRCSAFLIAFTTGKLRFGYDYCSIFTCHDPGLFGTVRIEF